MSNLCRHCTGWRRLGLSEFGTCRTLATPAPPIDGKPATSLPMRREDSGCERFNAA